MWQVCATQSYVCFGGSLFGQPTRFAFHFSKIESFRDLDAGDTALVELIVEPEHDDDGEDDSCFIFMFDTPEARDLFSYDVRAAHSQTHVWKQSRGCIRPSYRIEPHERRMCLLPGELSKIRPDERVLVTHANGRGRRPSSFEIEPVGAEGSRHRPRFFNEGMAQLVEGAKAILFDKEDIIIHEGNTDQRLYQIGKGSVRVEKGVYPTTVTVAHLQAGQVFGEMSLIAGGAASASIIADEDATTVYAFDGAYLRSAVSQQPSVGKFRQLGSGTTSDSIAADEHLRFRCCGMWLTSLRKRDVVHCEMHAGVVTCTTLPLSENTSGGLLPVSRRSVSAPPSRHHRRGRRRRGLRLRCSSHFGRQLCSSRRTGILEPSAGGRGVLWAPLGVCG